MAAPHSIIITGGFGELAGDELSSEDKLLVSTMVKDSLDGYLKVIMVILFIIDLSEQ